MQLFLLALALSACAPALAVKTQASPLDKVFQLMDELTAKIQKEGEAEDKAYGEFFEWCDDTARTHQEEIKTYSAKQGKLEAKITELTEDAEAASVKIEELAGRIADNEKTLKEATKIFEKETAEFEGSEAELAESVDTMSRAIGILEKEMAKAPGAFAQIDTSSMNGLLSALSIINEAAGFMAADQQKLAALIQQQSDDEDDEAGAPKAANYESKSGAIVDVLEDMKDKAETQLDKVRLDFTKTKQEYKMMKQSLESQLNADNKDKKDEETGMAEAEEGKATAEKDLSTTIKLLKDSTAGLAQTQSDCMRTAADHDESVKSRAEELKVIAKAKKIVKEATSLVQQPNEDDEEDPESFLQVSERSKAKAGSKVVTAVKKLAATYHSKSLASLASHIAALFEFGSSNGEDPFAKVKGMLKTMIDKLEKEGEEAAAEKAYCDEQMSKTEAKKSDLEDDVEKLKVKMDEATSGSAKLKEDVNILQKELAALAKEQGELDKARADSHKVYLSQKAELEKALKGIRKALDVLKDYYNGAAASAAMLQEGIGDFMKQPKVPTHSKSGGAGGSIISILEVCESDTAKELSAVEKVEADEAAEYEGITAENEKTKVTKEKDVKYKTQEYKALDNSLAEMSEDLKSTQKELDVVLEYYEKVKERCVAKPEPYEERVKRRNAEIKGLREALSILDNEAALVQSHKKGHRHFLGH